MASLTVVADKTPDSQLGSGFATTSLRHPVLLSFVLALATIAVYLPVHHFPFINYDDNDYVYRNRHVQAGLSLSTMKWAFVHSAAANWHPVTWLSHAADCQMFGLNPAGHHDMNLLFQVINVVLLFWVLLRATGYVGRSFMVAALFALHPINVEVVAWVAERKTLISTMFFLLALGTYRWYVRKPRTSRYVVVGVLFALGLMAKPQIIAFPFVLLLWDYWPLQRMSLPWDTTLVDPPFPQRTLRALVDEKLPLFVWSIASALITMHVQTGARSWFPYSSRFGNAILSYSLYLQKALWPSSLALLYPHPGTSLHWWKVIVSAVILCLITILVVLGRRHRYLPVGWFWFLGMMVPMLGIVQVGVQGMADRYAYVSFLGLFILICWGVADWARDKRLASRLLPAVSVLTLLALALTTRNQLSYWGTEEGLWRHALQVTDRNWVAHSELGAALAMHGRVPEGLQEFNLALAINPNDVNSNLGIAIDELQEGNFADALSHYRRVIQQPTTTPAILQGAYLSMAKAYRALGDNLKSQECLKKAKSIEVE